MYEAESRHTQGQLVRLVQEPSLEERNELAELLKQHTASALNGNERKQNDRGLGPNTMDRRERHCFRCHKKGHYIAERTQQPRDQQGNSKRLALQV